MLLFPIAGGVAAPHQPDEQEPESPSAGTRFIENKGQWDHRVQFKAYIPRGSLFVEKDAFTFSFLDFSRVAGPHYGNNDIPADGEQIVLGHSFRARFEGASPDVILEGLSRASEYHNYYLGNDPGKWAPSVGLFREVQMTGLYPGTDLHLYSDEGQLKYDFVLAPGADPNQIVMVYEGHDNISITDEGHLRIETSIIEITEMTPYAYQDIAGERRSVACNFRLEGNRLSFDLPEGFDPAYPLVIDPTVIFSSYIGSPSDTWGFTATYDHSGNLYSGGLVQGALYPTTFGAFQTVYGGSGFGGGGYGSDMCISKFNTGGTGLLYSTYLGGMENETPHSLVVNANNELIVYGRTYSNDFPVTAGAYDNTYNGGADMTVSKFNANGTLMLASTYIGGSGDDGVNINPAYLVLNSIKYNYGDDARGEVYVDDNGDIYVASCTRSANFPVTPGAYQTAFGATPQNGCVFKLSSNLSTLMWSTYLGGSNNDAAYSVVVDDTYNVYVTGGTSSNNFPTTPGVLSTTYAGGISDAFISVLSANGATLLRSTYLGTQSYDQAYFVQLDENFDVYVYGQTAGANYPVTTGVYSNASSGQFITKLDNNLTSIIFSTRFGNGSGAPNISPTAFLVDRCQNIYASGWGGPTGPQLGNTFGMPVTPDAFQATTTGGDLYVIVLERDARALYYASYIGGPTSTEHLDGGTCRFDKEGIIYHSVCAGCWGNSDFPTTPGAWSNLNGGGLCNIAAFKIQFDLKDLEADLAVLPSVQGCAPLTVYFENRSRGGVQYLWDFRDGNFSTDSNIIHTFTAAGTYDVMLVIVDSTSCDFSDTAYVTVTVINDTVEAGFSITRNIINCDSMMVTLTNTSFGGKDFFWDFGDGNTSTQFSPVHLYTTPGTYTITLIVEDTATCNKRDTVSGVVIFPPPVVADMAVDTVEGCIPLTVSFSHSSSAGANIGWDFGDGNTSFQNAPSHTYTVPGTYTVTHYATDLASCNIIDSVTIDITAHPLPVADFSYNPTFTSPKEIVNFMNLSTGAMSYLWSFGDGDTSTLEHPTHAYDDQGDYLVCLYVTNQYGCEDSICQTFTVKGEYFVSVPNAFTPNGDGRNDQIHVLGFGVARIEFSIFSRWGERVFETDQWGSACPGIHPELDCSNAWDGTFNGEPLPIDTYVYYLSVEFLNGDQVNRQGNLVLIR